MGETSWKNRQVSKTTEKTMPMVVKTAIAGAGKEHIADDALEICRGRETPGAMRSRQPGQQLRTTGARTDQRQGRRTSQRPRLQLGVRQGIRCEAATGGGKRRGAQRGFRRSMRSAPAEDEDGQRPGDEHQACHAQPVVDGAGMKRGTAAAKLRRAPRRRRKAEKSEAKRTRGRRLPAICPRILMRS